MLCIMGRRWLVSRAGARAAASAPGRALCGDLRHKVGASNYHATRRRRLRPRVAVSMYARGLSPGSAGCRKPSTQGLACRLLARAGGTRGGDHGGPGCRRSGVRYSRLWWAPPRDRTCPTALFGILLLLAVLAVARFAGILYALPVGVATILAFDWYFLPPLRNLDGATVLVLGLFLAMAVIVGAFATQAGRRAAGSEQARGVLARRAGGAAAGGDAGRPPALVRGGLRGGDRGGRQAPAPRQRPPGRLQAG